MVKKLAEQVELYQCEKCGHMYPTLEKALKCENSPVAPFKYEIGDMVLFQFKSHITGKRFVFRGIVESRWISGFSEKDDSAHRNVYKIRVVEDGKGLIACRYENEILRKVDLIEM
jgi:hypothetical protein